MDRQGELKESSHASMSLADWPSGIYLTSPASRNLLDITSKQEQGFFGQLYHMATV
jgi:hypothetical protein